MKRLIMLLLAAAAVLSLAACSVFSIDTDPYGTDELSPSPSAAGTPERTPAASPDVARTQSPSPSPSPTLSPTVPPEQVEAQKKYETLLGYCRDYLDMSAAAEIKGIYDKGRVTKEQFEALYGIWDGMKDYDADEWKAAQDETAMMADIINGRKSGLGEDDGEYFCSMMCTLPQQGAAYINLFDSQQKQDRMKAALDLVKKWYADPTDENMSGVEAAYYSEELTPGEILMLGYYIYYSKDMPARIKVDGTSTDTLDYIARQGYLDYADSAYYALIDINNGT
jgi:hypothetical protein